LGYAREELLGKELFEIGLLKDEETSRAAFRELLEKGAIRYDNLPLQSKTGARREVEFVSNLYQEGNHTIIQCNVRDITARKLSEEALRAADRHKNEFLAMLAHELRNPLAPISNAVQIMRHARRDEQVLDSTSAMMERQVGQMVRLVDDLLDVSRITRGKLRLQSGPMDLNMAVLRALESSRPLIDRRKQQLHLKLPSEPVMVNGDMTRISQVVINLLNNAAKYTSEGGEIWLEVDGAGHDAVIRVRDNGAGIPPQVLENIFDLFAQGERTIDRSEGGLGIGLTLARRIVALHGGDIVAQSEGPGKGSEFRVRLPRLVLEGADAARPPPETLELPPGAKKRTIVVVDDDPDAANSMAVLLRMVGHDVEIEHDGAAALARVLARPPDILLLDIGLPGMSGYEVAKQLRSRPEGKAIKIFALTGYGQEEDRKRSFASGIDGHLVKPVMPIELFSLIDDPPR
jgi:signal transduction histidine kinase/CheY-like chemotaxis protein